MAFKFGHCLKHRIGISTDLVKAIRCYKLPSGQGNAFGQCACGLCLVFGKGISTVLVEPADLAN
jgi:D-serine dehydratase